MAKDSREFPIQPTVAIDMVYFIYSQLFITPEPPNHSFADQTIVVTGSSSGLGLEAARSYYRLGAAKIILAVRSRNKGEAAKENIVRSVKTRSDGASVLELWDFNASSSESVLAFAERLKTLPRIDVLLLNAGVNQTELQLDEGIERTMQINVLNTFLLGLAALPRLSDTKTRFPDSSPHISITGSDAYHLTRFDEINERDVFEAFNNKDTFNGQARYQGSKLIILLVHQEIIRRLAKQETSAPGVTFNVVNPGLCVSNIDQKDGKWSLSERIVHKLFYRTTEVGSHTLVRATYAGPQTHGKFVADCKPIDLAAWIGSEMGKKAQIKMYEQTMAILEKRKPGIAAQLE